MIKTLKAHRSRKIDMRSKEDYEALYKLERTERKSWQFLFYFWLVVDVVHILWKWLV